MTRTLFTLGLVACFAQPLVAQVTFERLLNAEEEPQNWLTYSGNYDSNRHTALDQITTENVDSLELQWVFQAQSLQVFQTTPLVVDGIMYLTEAPNTVVALDAERGRVFWRYEYTPSNLSRPCCGRVNRGVAILGDTLFMGTIDAKLIAIDAISGEPIWQTDVADPAAGYALTLSPLIVKDKVIVGIAGGEYGIRGFISAYDVNTGEEAWKFYTIPGPGEPGHETWQDDDWMYGGASAWITGSYDPDTDLIYWGIGNPGPDWNPEQRPGDNLYSDSVVALNPDTGELEWYFQFTPNDPYDYDAVQVPVLIDYPAQDGSMLKLMLFGKRNGIFYILDRETGRSTRLFYMSTWENNGSNFEAQEAEYEPGRTFLGGRPAPPVPGAALPNLARGPINTWTESAGTGAVKALDPATGEERWKFPMTDVTTSGILTTATDVLFTGGREGYFHALDARNGDLLWRQTLGGMIANGPISYSIDGRQYVAAASGNALFVFALEQ